MATEYQDTGLCAVCGHRIVLADGGGCINGHPPDCITEQKRYPIESEEGRFEREREKRVEQRIAAAWLFRWAVPALSVMLGLAVLPMPSGYYVLLRWAALLIGVFVAWQYYEYEGGINSGSIGFFVFATVAVVWFLAPFPRAVWIPLDLVAGLVTARLAFVECRLVNAAVSAREILRKERGW